MHTAGVAHEPQPVVAVTRATMRHVSIVPVDGLPEIVAGDDLAGLIAAFSATTPQDVVVISQKVVSKAEGAVVRLDDITPSRRARRLARKFEKDARAVEVVLRQSTEVLRAERGVLITRTTHGFVCANSGVDASNTATGELVLLPEDPDASARRLRSRLPGRPAVVIADSFGRAWRQGQCDIAIGIAGLMPIDDWCGRTDRNDHVLRATAVSIADQAAAAADLVRSKDSGHPAVIVRGLDQYVTAADGPGAVSLIRPAGQDMFR
jgi:coenzyme F420-0:L-glutamate ligase/coenzyme F420-1:gamma-L-glutamate ligase